MYMCASSRSLSSLSCMGRRIESTLPASAVSSPGLGAGLSRDEPFNKALQLTWHRPRANRHVVPSGIKLGCLSGSRRRCATQLSARLRRPPVKRITVRWHCKEGLKGQNLGDGTTGDVPFSSELLVLRPNLLVLGRELLVLSPEFR